MGIPCQTAESRKTKVWLNLGVTQQSDQIVSLTEIIREPSPRKHSYS